MCLAVGFAVNKDHLWWTTLSQYSKGAGPVETVVRCWQQQTGVMPAQALVGCCPASMDDTNTRRRLVSRAWTILHQLTKGRWNWKVGGHNKTVEWWWCDADSRALIAISTGAQLDVSHNHHRLSESMTWA
jgi:hypothetical protein